MNGSFGRLLAASGPAIAAICLASSWSALHAQAQWQDVIRNLRHPNATTRLNAVERLGNAGYAPAAEAIAPLLADPDDRVQAAAMEAELSFFSIERIGGKSRAQEAFDAGPLVRSAMPAPAALVTALITAMRDENARVRFDAVHTLGFIAEAPLGPAEVRALAAELDHYDPIIRTATARVLGRLRARDAGDKLIVALSDSNATVRQYAVEALGLVREDRALPDLRDLIRRGRGRNISELLLAVARIGSPDDVTLFKEYVASRDAHTRRAAIEGLGRAGDRDSVETADRLLKSDKVPEVRLAAAFALQRLGQTQSHVIASMLILDQEAAQARDYLFEIGHDAVAGIAATLKVAKDAKHRADLIQAIGYVGTMEDIPLVEPFLKERDARIIRAATNSILRLRR